MGRRGDEDGPSVESFDGMVAAFCAGSRACRVPFYDLHADALKSEDQSDDAASIFFFYVHGYNLRELLETLEVERRLHGLASRPHQPRHRSGIHCVARREEKPFDAKKNSGPN